MPINYRIIICNSNAITDDRIAWTLNGKALGIIDHQCYKAGKPDCDCAGVCPKNTFYYTSPDGECELNFSWKLLKENGCSTYGQAIVTGRYRYLGTALRPIDLWHADTFPGCCNVPPLDGYCPSKNGIIRDQLSAGCNECFVCIFPYGSSGDYTCNVCKVSTLSRAISSVADGKEAEYRRALHEGMLKQGAISAALGARLPAGQLEIRSDPTIPEMTANFVGAIASWTKAGFPVVSKTEFVRRLAICDSCEFWDSAARLGYGKCHVCGCTNLKHWLATSECPIGKWKPVP